jgi:Ca2+-transporting ATPase
VSLALTSLFGLPLALNVLQILAIDLLGEIFPIAALGRDPEEGETMLEPPRDPRARILNRRSLTDIVWCGSLMGAFAMANFLFLFSRAGVNPTSAGLPAELVSRAMTITYVTIMVCQFVSIIQRRSVHGFFTRYQFTNRTFWFAILIGVTIMLVIVYVPIVSGFFGTGPLGATDWACIAAAAVLFLALREGERVLRRRLTTPARN